MMPRIHFIRHGETSWSLAGRYTGQTDLDLTPEGEEMARVLGRRLASSSFNRVFVSPRLRARRTAELAVPGPSLEVEPDLMEWDYGDFEGRASAVIRQQNPEWNLFRDGCPNGESPVQVSARADRLIARVRGLDGNIALVSHGHFGRVLAARWIGLPVAGAGLFLLGPASLSIFDFEHEQPDSPVIALWNCPP